jgi:L-rhamnose isomerase
MEELKTMPIGAVWDYYCEVMGVPVAQKWIAEIKQYEAQVLNGRK